ncbi:hypothetical protein [Bacillus phage vB_BanS-Thrax5]|nr:hypothetical protein [Bacillus phage vB_BanS-Thrax5]
MAIVASGQLTLVDLNDSKQLIMFIGSSQPRQVLYTPNGNVYTPNYATTNNTLTPQLFIAGTSGDVSGQATATRWYVQDGSTGTPRLILSTGQDATDYTLSGTTLVIKTNVLASKTAMTYICEMDYLDTGTGFTVTAKAEYEIVKVSNGSNGTNAIVGLLSNDSHTIPTDSAGNGGTWSSATTTMYVYNGITDDSQNWTYTAVVSGCTGAFGSGTSKNVYTLATMTADLAYVDITAKKAGSADIVKRFTISKNKSGVAGSNATAYWLLSSNVAIAKNSSGGYTPTSLTFTAKSQVGTATPTAYTGRFRVSESTDGTSFTVKSTSGDVSTYPHTPTAGIKAVKVELFQAGGVTVLLDEQIIPVVSDGSNGADGNDAVTAVVWTPDGNVLRNSNGTLTAKADLYKGAGIVSSGLSYKWYYQDPSSTKNVGGGGDADGGDGWRLMQAIQNPTTAPTLNGATAGGTLTGATYYVKYTWTTVEGETMVSPEASLAVTANYNLKITIPAFPSGVSGAKVYVGTTAGANKYQNVISTSGGTLTITAPINTGGANPPASNTAQIDNWGVTGFASNSNTITIPATSITNVESYKCVITYMTKIYTDVCTVMDVTDPILVTLVGSNIFKNGSGTTTLEAKLYQNGVEIDVKDPANNWNNQKYIYTWYLYDNNGAKMTTVPSWGAGFKNGKVVVVDGIDVDIRGNIICEVSTR